MAKKKNSRHNITDQEERVISEEFDRIKKIAMQVPHRGNAAKSSDLYGKVMRRRKSVTLAYMDKIKKRYGDRHEDFDVVREWARHCSIACHSIDTEDSLRHFTLAAAIWMLDELKLCGRLMDAFRYFYKEPVSLEPIYLPDIFDAWHDDSVIRGMMHLILHRDERNDPRKCYINEITAARTEPIIYKEPDGDAANLSPDELNMGPRERFNAIMSMIHLDVKQRAVERFESKQWEFLDGFFECSERYAIELAATERESDRLLKEGTDLQRILDDAQKKPVGPGAKPKIPFAVQPLTMPTPQDFTATGFLNYTPDNHIEDTRNKLERLAYRGLALQDKLEDIHLKYTTLKFLSPIASVYTPDDLVHSLSPEDADRLLNFEVDDPYETCFAFLYLIDAGSDAAWLYNTNMAVLTAAARKLPWFPEIYEEDGFGWEDGENFDEPEEVSAGDAKEAEIDYDLDVLSDLQRDWIQEKALLYKLKYKDVQFFSSDRVHADERMLNLPQLIYACTGLVMPRTVSQHSGAAEELIEAGMDPSAAAMVELYLELASDVQYPSKDWEAFLQSSRVQQINDLYGQSEPKEPPVENPADEMDVDTLLNQIRALKEKNDELRRILYTATKEADKNQAETKRVLNETANEHQELLDLRELVFNRANHEELPEEGTHELKVNLPYNPKQRTVVFGGHDSWLKAIKPLLPDVVFINRCQTPNTDMIKSADVVWIQANALSHKTYYKIINTVRTHHIPVRYFGYASVRKCAEQLALEDRCLTPC